ncbi:MAG TPA: prolyl oligopeptidase family serine peptidase, partial [Streptosporangiaceae bacterium]|nr:prolyl oligopeptidase family serine peptidase [Streptosporangiaceae bacterium]
GHIRLSFPEMSGDGTVWWQETRPAEAGRQTVCSRGPDGINRNWLAAPWNARTRLHEYGGRSYLPVPEGLLFASLTDQRLYLCREPGAEPQPLTQDNGDRYADFTPSPDGRDVLAVRERHASAGLVTRDIVAIPLEAGPTRVLVTGSDFFAFPTPSPDGTRLAWICWDHPRMPWDGTELRVAPLDDTASCQTIMGSASESVVAPLWRDDTSLYAMSDRSGWWNPYLISVDGSQVTPLCPRDEEFAGPLWQLGARPYAILGDGRLAVARGTLAVLDPKTGELNDIGVPYRVFTPGRAESATIAGLAGSPDKPLSVVTVDVSTGTVTVIRQEADDLPDTRYLPVPRAADMAGPDGVVVHALVYPPRNPLVTAPDGERPPYVVWVHGGPTARVQPLLDLEKAYFTSRGIGIIDVNYGGSSGYGRAYRERLNGQWGVVDVVDCTTAALALADQGEADGQRLGIRGGSAGGWTALAAVTSGLPHTGKVFAAAVSYFGVADLRGFAHETHDFESRYLDGLIGPMPDSEDLYLERAPVGHVSDATCPVLLLQGLDDPVVPPKQAESIARDLASHGIPHAYIAFEGESHGFRKAETIVTCLESELSFYGRIMGFTPPGVRPIQLM